MKLFVANTSTQIHNLLFRVPEDRRIHSATIPAGKQRQVWTDAPMIVLRAIVKQHERYGMVDASKTDRTTGFVGLCYSFDKPVDIENMLLAIEQNSKVQEASTLARQKLIAHATMDAAIQVGRTDESARISGLTLETIEVREKASDTPGLVQATGITLDGRPTRYLERLRQAN